jgi:hypothetical protein
VKLSSSLQPFVLSHLTSTYSTDSKRLTPSHLVKKLR